MSCQFSLPYVGSMSIISPSGEYVASLSATRLTVRSISSLETTHIFLCIDKVDKIEFSPDSTLVLCALYARNAIQVFSLEDKNWKCRINEGVAGIINAFWAPDSRSILTESDFGIQLSVWSLVDTNTSLIISMPKPPYALGNSSFCNYGDCNCIYRTAAFSDCGRFLVVLHRQGDLQDRIGIYTLGDVAATSGAGAEGGSARSEKSGGSLRAGVGAGELSKFRARSNDVAGVQWLPGGTHVLTVDTPLQYRFCVYTPMGEMLASYEAYQHALGIRSLAAFRPARHALAAGAHLAASAPSGTSAMGDETTAAAVSAARGSSSFLALGSFDSKVRLLSMHSWQLAFVLPLVAPAELPPGFSGRDVAAMVEVSAASTASSTADVGKGAAAATTGELVHQRQDRPMQRRITSELRTGLAGTTSATLPAAPQRQPQRSLPPSAPATATVKGKENEARASCYVSRSNLKALPKNNSLASSSSFSSSAVGSVLKPRDAKKKPVGSGGGSSGGLPPVGVSWLGWSCDGELLAARDEAHPRCLWIWKPYQCRLEALLVQLEPITCCSWRPAQHAQQAHQTEQAERSPDGATVGPLLAFCTGSSRVYFWTPAGGATYAELPTDLGTEAALAVGAGKGRSSGQFAISRMSWSENGEVLLLRGKETHCVCSISFDDSYHHLRPRANSATSGLLVADQVSSSGSLTDSSAAMSAGAH